jgi:DNA helicase-2/ATP-dependent DNA helicase PcrA
MSAPRPEILADLNEPQREAVTTLSGPLLILAGAGSGKTRVVTRRIACLIANGVRPWEILAITFTNKAAGEMRRRVEDLVGASGVWLATFHSFCARILRREAGVLQLSPDFSIYDVDDTAAVLRDVLRAMHLDDRRYTPGVLRQTISRLKAAAVGPDDMEAGSFHQRCVQQVYEEYQRILKKNQALDFDDLLLRGVDLLRGHEEVLRRYRERFRHLLVDEYQDTNGCQYELVKLLGQAHRNVCATGDPDQSIYAWRGADVQNILSFEKDFPEAKVVRLEQNYRSTGRILAVASAVIRHNQDRKEKDLWSEKAEGEKVVLITAENDDAERKDSEPVEVATQVKRQADDGRSYREIAVFYRTNAQSRALETAFIRAGIPYQLVGGTPFYERREVKDALAYLRLIVNPADDVSFARIVNVPRRGLGDATLDPLAKEAARRNGPLFDVLADGKWLEREIKPKPRAELVRFAGLITGWRGPPAGPVRPLVVRVLEESGLLGWLKGAGEDERSENLEQLVNAAAEYDERCTVNSPRAGEPPPEPGAYDGLEDLQAQGSLSGFLENAALVQPTDALAGDAERATLMTLHMAKGLEFPVVFITGLEDGLLPLMRSARGARDEGDYDPDAERRALEEERRLFYVGVTRAQERVFLLHARFRMKYGHSERTVPSRFLAEIPHQLLDRQDTLRMAGLLEAERAFVRRGERKHGARSFEEFEKELDEFEADGPKARAPKLPADPVPVGAAGRELDRETSQDDFAGLDVGDRVHHPKFGEGQVVELRGSGLDAKARILFGRAGSKLILLSHARLRKL